MKYLKFHFIFNIPILGGLFFFSPAFSSSGIWAVMILLLGAITVISIWGNHAVESGFWNYKLGDYLFRVRHLPVEVYFGIIFQALMVAIITHFLLKRFPTPLLMPRELPNLTSLVVLLPMLIFIVGWGWAGNRYSRRIWWEYRKWSYAWHILYWFLPILILEWIPGWSIFLPRWPYLLLPTLLVGTYLSICDFVAARWELWFFDRKQTLGWKVLATLPWERVLANYLGCMILTQSFILLLPTYLR